MDQIPGGEDVDGAAAASAAAQGITHKFPTPTLAGKSSCFRFFETRASFLTLLDAIVHRCQTH